MESNLDITAKEKWELIVKAIDQFTEVNTTDQPKIYLHPSQFEPLRGFVKPYKRCCFEYDNRIPKDEFMICPVTHLLDE